MTGHEIKMAREALGLSFRGLAKELGLSPDSGPRRVRDWEDGNRDITGPAARLIVALILRGRDHPLPDESLWQQIICREHKMETEK